MDFIAQNFLSLAKAIHVLSPRYDNIYLPIKGSFAYDLIGDCKGSIHKVKVFHTESKAPSGSYIVNIRKSGGYNKGNTQKKPFDPNMCDVVFIDSPEGCYFIPSHQIDQKRAITLSMFREFFIKSS